LNTYDLIGDIHGYATTLEFLLKELGYTAIKGYYSHSDPSRKVIFLGDLIDRGPRQMDTVTIVRHMVEAGHAYCVMGNHEFNAVCYHSKIVDFENIDHRKYTEDQVFLRKHSAKNLHQHEAFLQEFDDEQQRTECIEWFKTLPLWIEIPGQLRIIHACWHQKTINALVQQNVLTAQQQIRSECWPQFALAPKSKENYYLGDPYIALEILLKGPEMKITGFSYEDTQNNCIRDMLRIKWWEDDPQTMLHAVASIDDMIVREHLQSLDFVDQDEATRYWKQRFDYHDRIPVFFGHYWRKSLTFKDHLACLDLSVAKTKFKGQLAAYHWQGEEKISPEHFTVVDRQEF
jgi:hypothetical protein